MPQSGQIYHSLTWAALFASASDAVNKVGLVNRRPRLLQGCRDDITTSPGLSRHPGVASNWDNTQRAGERTRPSLLRCPGSSRQQMCRGIAVVKSNHPEERHLFVKFVVRRGR